MAYYKFQSLLLINYPTHELYLHSDSFRLPMFDLYLSQSLSHSFIQSVSQSVSWSVSMYKSK